MTASKAGNSGADHAVGPLEPPKGLAKPCPMTSERAIRPRSHPKTKWSFPAGIKYVCHAALNAARSTNAAPAMSHGDVQSKRRKFSDRARFMQDPFGHAVII